MTSHIGEVVDIADPNHKGLINDHVHIILGSNKGHKFNIYSRNSYQIDAGPLPIPYGGIVSPSDFPDLLGRGWEEIEVLGEGLSILSAMRLARNYAVGNRRVLLFFNGDTSEIRWHPEGWEPQYG